MTDFEELAPCARGCTWTAENADEPPRPKPAKHGQLCNSCFYRIRSALNLVPDLMANMRAQLFSLGAADYSERVSGGGGESPAPLNLGPLDAGDGLFAKLLLWITLFAEELQVDPPKIPSWANGREVQGSKPVSPEAAHLLGAYFRDWLNDRAEPIAATAHAVAYRDDITDGWEDSRGIFSLARQYGIEPRPIKQAEDRECPLCGELAVFIKWPDGLDPEMAVLCGRCSWVADPKLYRKYVDLAAG